jgi:CHAD domain-containing protein
MESHIRYLAALWFQRQSRRLGKQLPGIRQAEDIECVHRARVACRRLRAGLELFTDWPSAKRHRRWQCGLRRLGRKLGQARDKDVQLIFLSDQWDRAPSLQVRVGLAGLILVHQAQREAAYRKADKAVVRFRKTGVLQEIQGQSRRVLRQVNVSQEELLLWPLWEGAAEKIQLYTDELTAYAPSLQHGQDHTSHHAMRIAAKKLRYSLEILSPLLGPAVHPVLQALEEFQTRMGQLHDCQVWLMELEAFQDRKPLRRMRKKWEKVGLGSAWNAEAFRAAVCWLQEDRRLAQAKLLEEVGWFWHARLQEEVGDRLARLVQQALLRGSEASEGPQRQFALGWRS